MSSVHLLFLNWQISFCYSVIFVACLNMYIFNLMINFIFLNLRSIQN